MVCTSTVVCVGFGCRDGFGFISHILCSLVSDELGVSIGGVWKRGRAVAPYGGRGVRRWAVSSRCLRLSFCDASRR